MKAPGARPLLALAGLALLGAVAFALWPVAEPAPASEPERPAAPAAVAVAAASASPRAPRPEEPLPERAAAPVAAREAPAPMPPGAAPAGQARVVAPPPAGPTPEPRPGSAPPGDAGAIHALSPDGIRGAVREKLPELKECYEAWLAQRPDLAGTLKVDFTISETDGGELGAVTGVTVLDGGLGHLAMEGCVRNVFDELRFERPSGGTLRVTYPLRFSNAAAP